MHSLPARRRGFDCLLRRRGALTGLAPLVLALLAGACHHGANPTTQSAPRAETAVRVDNQNFLDMDVFVVRSGQHIRLGTVPGLSTQLFMLRPEIVGSAAELQFAFHPIGGRANPRTETITVHAGDVIELTLPPT
jgi:hypothetical protein